MGQKSLKGELCIDPCVKAAINKKALRMSMTGCSD